MAITHEIATRNGICTAVATDIDTGGGGALLKIYTAGFATLLATLTLSDPSFGSPSWGSMTANSITPDTNAAATGAAAKFRIYRSDGTTLIFTGDVGIAGSGFDLILSSTAIVSGATVAVVSFTYTAPP
jgi:hypothetical protein